jgi:hypothetical protein
MEICTLLHVCFLFFFFIFLLIIKTYMYIYLKATLVDCKSVFVIHVPVKTGKEFKELQLQRQFMLPYMYQV